MLGRSSSIDKVPKPLPLAVVKVVCAVDRATLCQWLVCVEGLGMLTASRIASVTNQLLRSLGVNVSVWGPHSTRGAGVTMYKSLELSSEEVCEIGQWKNT